MASFTLQQLYNQGRLRRIATLSSGSVLPSQLALEISLMKGNPPANMDSLEKIANYVNTSEAITNFETNIG